MNPCKVDGPDWPDASKGKRQSSAMNATLMGAIFERMFRDSGLLSNDAAALEQGKLQWHASGRRLCRLYCVSLHSQKSVRRVSTYVDWAWTTLAAFTQSFSWLLDLAHGRVLLLISRVLHTTYFLDS